MAAHGWLSFLVFLHVLGAAAWVGGTLFLGVLNRALRGRMTDAERRETIRHVGRRAQGVLWGGLALAALSGLALADARGLLAPARWGPLMWTKAFLTLLSAGLALAHVRLGRVERPNPARAAVLGVLTLLAGLGLLYAGALLRWA